MGFFLVCLLLVPFAIGIRAVSRPKHAAWGRRLLRGTTTQAFAPYRATTIVRWKEGTEPAVARLTSSFTAFRGGMLFPGGFFGLLLVLGALIVLGKGSFRPEGVLVIALAASVPTGMIIALRCLAVCSPILENRAGITQEMRRLATHTIAQNAYVGLAYVVCVAMTGELALMVLTVFNVIAFMHAALLHHCANVMDRENAENEACERMLTGIADRPLLALQEVDDVDVEFEPRSAAQSEQPIPISSTSIPGVSTAMSAPV